MAIQYLYLFTTTTNTITTLRTAQAERIQFKLAVLVYNCLHGTAASYLADGIEYTADFKTQRRLQSASWLSLNVRHTRLSTVSDYYVKFG